MWIDVENSSGLRLGAITTARRWNCVRKLDGAGTWSFEMPASDRQSALLSSKRIVRCWTREKDILKEIGVGVIDEITVKPSTDQSPAMLLVSGGDLLRELANKQVGDLELFDTLHPNPTKLTFVVTDDPPGAGYEMDLYPPFGIDLDPDPRSYLYIKHAVAFNEIEFVLGTVKNTTVAPIMAQFYNAETVSWDGVSVTDGTEVDGATLAQSGSMVFSMPSGWGTLDGNYIIRLSQSEYNLTAVVFNNVTLKILEPTADALQKTMALAPSGWSLDTVGGQTKTDDTVYLQMNHESVLATLVMIAEHTGEHFALSMSGRRVRWLGNSHDNSGLRAIAPPAVRASDNPSTLQILSVDKTNHSYDLFTRLYAFGGGTGKARVTMADATYALPTGYTLNASAGYIEGPTASITEYGIIESSQEYSEIEATDVSASARVNAANTLVRRALQDLMRFNSPQVAYNLKVMPSTYDVWTGQKIRVTYHEWVDAFHSVNIDAELWVLETQFDVNDDDLRTVGLVVSTVDRQAVSSIDWLVKSIKTSRISRSQPSPLSALTTTNKGVPVSLGIENGMVTRINREASGIDGRYEGIQALTFRNGLVTAIEV